MGGIGIASACSVVFGAVSAGCFGAWVYAHARLQLNIARGLRLGRAERQQFVLASVAKPFHPLSACLLRVQPIRDIAHDASLVLPGMQLISSEEVVSVSLLGAAVLAVCGTVLAGSVVFGIALTATFIAGAWCAVRYHAHKTYSRMRDLVPQAMRVLSDSFRAGHSLQQTMQQASKDLEGHLGTLFGRVSHRLESGYSTHDALEPLRCAHAVKELAFVAVALDVQHKSGGSIAPVLESARNAVEGELELARTLRVQTAQAKLSASIVTVMPFVLIAFFSLVSPGFLSPFFESALGLFLLGVALVMQVGGILSVRRICKVDE